MDTILAIDLGKNKSVVCELERGSLKTQYHTVRTRPEVFHDLFAELYVNHSIMFFEVGTQAGRASEMLRTLGLAFKVANTNDPAWKWADTVRDEDKKVPQTPFSLSKTKKIT